MSRSSPAVYWAGTNAGTDGVCTDNGGVNIVALRWGTVSRVDIHKDVSRLRGTLERLGRTGNAAALAPAIADPA